MLALHATRSFRLVRRPALVSAVLLLAALLFALPLSLATRALATSPAAGPVYTLAALDADLARRPRAWLGRTLRVQALLGGKCVAMVGLYTQSCASWEMALTDPAGDQAVAPLPLTWGDPPSLIALLRRLPLLGWLAPPPQIAHSSATATYRIKLQTTPCAALDDGPVCYGAQLLDARHPDNTTDWVRIGS